MKVIEADVLVIGGGGAGCRAAIEAAKYTPRVILVAKGPLARSGATMTTMPGMCAILDPDDSPEVFFQDIIKGGQQLSDENVVKYFSEKAAELVQSLEKMGVRFDRGEDGKVITEEAFGHSFKREIGVRDELGRALYNALINEINKWPIVVMQDTFVTSLLATKDGEVRGATAISMDDGEFVVFFAKSTVLAAGGFAALYSVRTTEPWAVGDGLAMGYRAGAELMDLEFVQSNPEPLLYPESVRGVIGGVLTYIKRGAKYKNGMGEPFMARYDPVRKDKTTRDIVARAMHREIAEGRGSPRGNIYLDFSEIEDLSREERLRFYQPGIFKYLQECGVDLEYLLYGPLEIGPAAHFTCGGVRTNEKTETNVRRLFAAGEVTAGLHGANRLASNALPEIFIFGQAAGERAAQYALGSKKGVINKEASNLAEKEEMTAFKILQAQGSIRPLMLRRKIEETMFLHVGFGRDEKGLRKALEIFAEIQQRDIPKLYVGNKSPIFNMDWIGALEVSLMLDVAKMVAQAALARRETRGCHFRWDYQEREDAKWGKHIVLKKRGDEIQVTLSPRIKLS